MKVTIVGAGKSGLAAAKLAKTKGYDVFLTESKPPDNNDLITELHNLDLEFEFSGHSDKAVKNCDLIVTSPGVPPTIPLFRSAENKGISIISELEFSRSFLTRNPLIAITGTNGKTTTTALTEYIFKQAGIKAIAAGNIGTPLSDLVGAISDDTVIIAEVSSYQLTFIKDFRPDVAVILNVSPDHIKYHGSYEAYIQAKLKIFCNQIEKDFLILNADDSELAKRNLQTRGETLLFSLKPIEKGIWIDKEKMFVKLKDKHKEEEIMQGGEIRLPGVHNCYNSMAAALAARVFEIRNENIRDSLMSFSGVEHRLEYVRSINGVEFINDSKATNINATWFALASYSKPIVWIAGGRGDSNDYSILDDLVKPKVKAIIAIGEEADSIFSHFCTFARVEKADSLENAIQKAQSFADSGDVVLFAPACKSFDMFFNFEHRGDCFKSIVNSI